MSGKPLDSGILNIVNKSCKKCLLFELVRAMLLLNCRLPWYSFLQFRFISGTIYFYTHKSCMNRIISFMQNDTVYTLSMRIKVYGSWNKVKIEGTAFIHTYMVNFNICLVTKITHYGSSLYEPSKFIVSYVCMFFNCTLKFDP